MRKTHRRAGPLAAIRSAVPPLTLLGLTTLGACNASRDVGPWLVDPDGGTLSVTRADGSALVNDLAIELGIGSADVDFQSGAYLFSNETVEWKSVAATGHPIGKDPAYVWTLRDDAGDVYGQVSIAEQGAGRLAIAVDASDDAVNRVRFSLPCNGDDHFAGFGQHAQDVDHVGQAFPLWVSEPGIGKETTENQGADWFLTGTRHASSYPDPFFILPDPLGVEVVTSSRVEVDLCTADRWTMNVWNKAAQVLFYDVKTPLEAVQQHALRLGTPVIPPEWAFAPWNDAVGGEERVRAVASTLREAGATSGVLWTEDWKGGEDGAYGYHLLPNWEVDETLYPDAAGIAADLTAQGYSWFAYFQPFLVEGTPAWDEASSFAIRKDDGTPYTFTGVTFETSSVLDLSRDDARAWAESKMQAALDLGFTGWMADFAEWFPTDANIAEGNAMDLHNDYPLWWQETNAAVLNHIDPAAAHPETQGVMFTRSGWTGSPTLSPVGWAGDQRTSFDTDDGLPTVLPMGIGAGIAGVPMFTHDIGGYQSIGNAPSTKELWWRWCTLGAFTPIMRTHHGAFKSDNWQFDSDEETLAFYAYWARFHGQLAPYLRGLAFEAQRSGTPLVLAPFLKYPEEPWDRMDAWLLGDLLVAPVVEQGALGRQVDLPSSAAWFDFWTGAPAESGRYDVPLDSIAVFAPRGAIIPMYTDPPDTLRDGPLPGLVTRDEVDTARTVTLFASGTGNEGASYSFTEADGTVYAVSGTCTGPGNTAFSTSNGSFDVNGLRISIQSPIERVYTVIVR